MDQKQLNIAMISDIHGLWPDIVYPKADVLIIAGDIFNFYSYDRRMNAKFQLEEAETLGLFLDNLKNIEKYKEIIMVAGNHDFCFEVFPNESRSYFEKIKYLENSSCEIEGFKIYGSPMTPWFGGWAFNFPNQQDNYYRARAHTVKCWDNIPDNVDILITHGPPKDILDETAKGDAVGCPWLAKRLPSLKQLKLHVFGHIHASSGCKKIDQIQYVNAAQCFSHSKLSFNPYQITLKI